MSVYIFQQTVIWYSYFLGRTCSHFRISFF